MHRLLVRHTDNPATAAHELQVTAVVPSYRVDGRVPRRTIDLDDNATLDEEIDAPHPREQHLRNNSQSSVDEGETHERLRPGLGTSIDTVEDSSLSRCHLNSKLLEVLPLDHSLVQCAVEHSDRDSPRLAANDLDQGIQHTHAPALTLV